MKHHICVRFVWVFGFVCMTVILASSLAAEDKGNLTVFVTGFENNNGTAKLALVNSKQGYTSGEFYRKFETIISNRSAKQVIENLLFGKYAIKVFHDENNNGKLDTMLFGIPSERYGFSNNARGKMGPPEYEKVMFSFDAHEMEIHIIVK